MSKGDWPSEIALLEKVKAVGLKMNGESPSYDNIVRQELEQPNISSQSYLGSWKQAFGKNFIKVRPLKNPKDEKKFKQKIFSGERLLWVK